MTVETALTNYFDSFQETSLLIAYSGGIDSGVLLHGFVQCSDSNRHSIAACYVEHPNPEINDQSGREELLINECTRLGVPLISERIDPGFCIDLAQQKGLEAAYRICRYELLHACAVRLGAKAILLAHHAEDMAETVFMQITQGRLFSVTGIPQTRTLTFPQGYTAPFSEAFHDLQPDRVIPCRRPLLECRKQELIGYAQQHGIAVYEDPGNDDTTRTRNYIRHKVLPSLTPRFSKFTEALQQLAGEVQSLASYLRKTLPQWTETAAHVSYPLETFLSLPRVLQLDVLHTGMQMLMKHNKSGRFSHRFQAAQFNDFLLYIESVQCGRTAKPQKRHFLLSADWTLNIDTQTIEMTCNAQVDTLFVYVDIAGDTTIDIRALLKQWGEQPGARTETIHLSFASTLIRIRSIYSTDLKKKNGFDNQHLRMHGICIEDQKANKVLLFQESLPFYMYKNYNEDRDTLQYIVTLRY